jgi:hypothetical protein
MKTIQLLVLNFSIVTFGLLTVDLTAATAQDASNQSDTTGNTIEPPFEFNNNYTNGTDVFNPSLSTGGIAIPGFDEKFTFDPKTNTFVGESQQITINDSAQAIASDLNQSLEDLVAAENAQKTASTGPRHIVRRATDNCKDVSLEARSEVEKKLEQAREFVDSIESIDPGNSIW